MKGAATSKTHEGIPAPGILYKLSLEGPMKPPAKILENEQKSGDTLHRPELSTGAFGDTTGHANCRVEHYLVKLYRERDEHLAKAAITRRQIERDERDVAKLLMTAARYQQSAERQSELIRKERQEELDLVRLAEEKERMIGYLHRVHMYPPASR
jgi:hypothetical protein